MANIWTNGDTIICLSRKHFGKRRNWPLQAVFLFPQCFQKQSVVDVFNPLPDMPILGSSNSAANKDMSKIRTNGDTIIWLKETLWGKRAIAPYEQLLLFPLWFQKLSVVDALKWVSMEFRVKFFNSPEKVRKCEIASFLVFYFPALID